MDFAGKGIETPRNSHLSVDEEPSRLHQMQKLKKEEPEIQIHVQHLAEMM